MSSVMVADEDLPAASTFLARLRLESGRRPGDTLHWKNFNHPLRVHASQCLGSQDWATISSVVVCKRHLTGGALNDDQAYLYTLRYLLERLTWYARDAGRDVHYTLAHIVRFKTTKLREYEERLRNLPDCKIEWQHTARSGGKIDQPSRVEYLQLADIAASATFQAFERDRFGNTELRYLQALSPRLYRRIGGALTSYGLKIHPTAVITKAAYPWVAAL